MSGRRMSERRRVAILVHTSTSWGTQLIDGIADYAQQHGPWLFYVEPRGAYERLRLPRGWSGGGIIARVTTASLADEIIASKIPAVDVSWHDFGGGKIPRCRGDERLIGQLAAEHLLDCGLRNFAVCGPVRRRGYADRISAGFVDRIQDAGFECTAYHPKRTAEDPRSWKVQLNDLKHWLVGLPKPIGVLTWYSVRGRQVTEACQYANLNVPDEVAVIAGGFDHVMSRLSNPPLSSVDAPAYRVGYEAAALLDRLMAGQAAPLNPILIPPTGVTPRQSSDILTVADPSIRTAIRFIRNHAHEPIQVHDILDHVPLSRRMLEIRFREVLGRSPAAEIRRVRLDRAKRLLVETDLAIPFLADACGFAEPGSLARAFRKVTGMSPTGYRHLYRPHSSRSAGGPGRAEN